jgi:hypothetical protein
MSESQRPITVRGTKTYHAKSFSCPCAYRVPSLFDGFRVGGPRGGGVFAGAAVVGTAAPVVVHDQVYGSGISEFGSDAVRCKPRNSFSCPKRWRNTEGLLPSDGRLAFEI